MQIGFSQVCVFVSRLIGGNSRARFGLENRSSGRRGSTSRRRSIASDAPTPPSLNPRRRGSIASILGTSL